MNNKIKKTCIFLCLISLPILSFAAYYPSPDLITNNNDALEMCPQACSVDGSQWTGAWWNVGGPSPQSICECFHSWPYCPVITPPEPATPCYPGN